VYRFDSLTEKCLTTNEMKFYVYGERDAHITYKSDFSSILGLAIGAASGYYMHKDKSFVYIATPFVYTALTLPFGTHIKQQDKIKNKDFLKEDQYLRGYDRISKAKRTTNALKNTTIGMGIGLIISFIVNK